MNNVLKIQVNDRENELESDNAFCLPLIVAVGNFK